MKKFRIEKYGFGKIVINDQEYTRDVIVLSERIISNWWRKEGHNLQVDDIKDILKESPDILIIGTGKSGCMEVDDSVLNELENRGIEVLIQRTDSACKTFNEYSGDKKIVGAFHLTC